MGFGLSRGESPQKTRQYGNHGISNDLTQSTEELRNAGHEFRDGRLYDYHQRRPFEFNVYSRHSDNQSRYEKLGKIVERYIYGLLQQETKGGFRLVKQYLPFDSRREEGSFIFVSHDIQKKEKILILMHGSGVVRAGQWSRRLIMNVSLDAGSMLPYIRKAHEFGFGVIVLNTNQHADYRGHYHTRSPEHHFEYVWKNLVEKLGTTQKVAIITHSYGGSVVMEAAKNIPNFMERTFAVALTDCWVSDSMRLQSWLSEKVCNWVTSSAPVGTNIRSYGNCPTVSGGTTVHEETPWKAFQAIWSFIFDRLDRQMTSSTTSFALTGVNDQTRKHGSLKSRHHSSIALMDTSSNVNQFSDSFVTNKSREVEKQENPKSQRKTSRTTPVAMETSSSDDKETPDRYNVAADKKGQSPKPRRKKSGVEPMDIATSVSNANEKRRKTSNATKPSVNAKRVDLHKDQLSNGGGGRKASKADATREFTPLSRINLRRVSSVGNVSVTSERSPKVEKPSSISNAGHRQRRNSMTGADNRVFHSDGGKIQRTNSVGNVSVTSTYAGNIRHTNKWRDVSKNQQKPALVQSSVPKPKVSRQNSFGSSREFKQDRFSSSITGGITIYRTGPLDLLGGTTDYAAALKKSGLRDRKQNKEDIRQSRNAPLTTKTYSGLSTPYATWF